MTLLLIAVTTLLGTVISVLLAAGRRSGSRLLRSVITGYVELIRNTPFLVQLFFIYFGLPSLGIRLDPFAAAILAMTLNMAAYTTEIVGAGLDAVPKGQKEAASALGLHPVQVFMKIVLPQALKVIYPALTSQIIIMMLESAVVSQIAVRELTFEADMIQARTFRAFETYLVVTLVYLGTFHRGAAPAHLVRTAHAICRWRHDRIHLLGHPAQPAVRDALDDPAVGRGLRRRRLGGDRDPAGPDLEADLAEAVRQGLHRPLPGNAAADAAVSHVLRPADRSASASNPGRRRWRR